MILTPQRSVCPCLSASIRVCPCLSVSVRVCRIQYFEKRPLGKPTCRCEDNIKMDLREIGCEDVEWIHLTQDTDQGVALVKRRGISSLAK